MFSSGNLSDALRAVASSLQYPVVFILLLLIAITVVLFGTLIGELFSERIHMKAKMPVLVDKLRACMENEKIIDIVKDSGLLKRQKKALLELTSHPDITNLMRESLAVRLIQEEKSHYDNILKLSDMIARLGPMFGLLGTLIPLGPGIIALGQGDTYTLSLSLLTAFDTTIAGLVSAALAFIISAVRRSWYTNYMSALEMAMECVLEVEKTEKSMETEKDENCEKVEKGGEIA